MSKQCVGDPLTGWTSPAGMSGLAELSRQGPVTVSVDSVETASLGTNLLCLLCEEQHII